MIILPFSVLEYLPFRSSVKCQPPMLIYAFSWVLLTQFIKFKEQIRDKASDMNPDNLSSKSTGYLLKSDT